MKNLKKICIAMLASLMLASAPATAVEPTPPKPMSIVIYVGSTNWKVGQPIGEQDIGPHIEYMSKLFEQGTLIANGPQIGSDPLRGYYVFNTGDKQKIQSIIKADPAVKTKVLKALEVVTWAVLINQFAGNKEGEQFYLLRYKPGANWISGKPLSEQNIGEHFNYITAQTKQGTVVAGGPNANGKEGLYIICAANKNQAESFIAKDPGVAAGIFAPVMIEWEVLQMQPTDHKGSSYKKAG